MSYRRLLESRNRQSLFMSSFNACSGSLRASCVLTIVSEEIRQLLQTGQILLQGREDLESKVVVTNPIIHSFESDLCASLQEANCIFNFGLTWFSHVKSNPFYPELAHSASVLELRALDSLASWPPRLAPDKMRCSIHRVHVSENGTSLHHMNSLPDNLSGNLSALWTPLWRRGRFTLDGTLKRNDQWDSQ